MSDVTIGGVDDMDVSTFLQYADEIGVVRVEAEADD